MVLNQSAKFWVRTLCALLLLLTLVYCIVHDPPRGAPAAFFQMSGRDRVHLCADQRDVVADLLYSGRRIAPCDTSAANAHNCPANFGNNPHRYAALTYIGLHFRNWMAADSLLQVKVMEPMTEKEVEEYLVRAEFTMQSYFWLVGWRIMIEVIFWTWFGAFGRILYSIYRTNRAYAILKANDPTYDPDPENRGFDPGEVHNYVAQLAFAPFISMILTLGFHFFMTPEASDLVEASIGVLVTSYLLGFYCSRAMALLQRIRDVLLPVDIMKDAPVLPPPAPPTPKPPTPEALPPAPLADLSLQLVLAPQLSASEELDAELLNNQLDKATVLLRPSKGGEPIPAVHDGNEQGGGYVAKRIPLGAYDVEANVHAPDGINLVGRSSLDLAATTHVSLTMERDGHDG